MADDEQAAEDDEAGGEPAAGEPAAGEPAAGEPADGELGQPGGRVSAAALGPDQLDDAFAAILARWDEAEQPPLPEGSGWRSYALPEADEHFEPPDPSLPPPHDATYWLALTGLTLGPLVVLWAAVLSGQPDPGWWVLAGILATIGGFGLLVLRGSGDHDPDDDGAVV